MNLIQQENNTFKRISKAAARSMWNNGKAYDVFAMPCNARLDNPWFGPAPLCSPDGHTVFENAVNAFEFYNCNDAQLGRRAAFFIKKA